MEYIFFTIRFISSVTVVGISVGIKSYPQYTRRPENLTAIKERRLVFWLKSEPQQKQTTCMIKLEISNRSGNYNILFKVFWYSVTVCETEPACWQK